MGGITKSLWELISGAFHNSAPASDARIPIASQPGTPLVTQIDYVTIAELFAAASIQGLLPLQRFETVLNDAQLKAAADTQIEITEGGVASPKVRFPLFVTVQVNTNNGNYTNLDAAGFLQVTWADSGAVACAPVDTGLASLNQSALVYLNMPLVQTALSVASSRPKLKISNNGSGAFTGGGAGNYLKVETWYSIVPLR